jgi:hypothetical protein
MKKIQLEGSMDSPNVTLDKDSGVFEITGKSLPENVNSFYDPIIGWFEEYFQTPNNETLVSMKMDYINTASSKVLLSLFLLFEKASMEGKNIKVNWFYQEDDEDMYDVGEEYSEIVNVPFEIIAYDGDE